MSNAVTALIAGLFFKNVARASILRGSPDLKKFLKVDESSNIPSSVFTIAAP
jgi:hypothetical protein